MNDIDLIFTELADINERLYDLETLHLEKEYGTMTQVLEYGLVLDAGVLTATPTEVYTVSQYEELILKANVSGLAGTNKTIKLSISSPEYTDGAEAEPDDFEYTMHLIPSVEGSELFTIHLNEFLGESLSIGVLNDCRIMFSIITSNDVEYLSNIVTLGMYKTNTDLSYEPTNLSAVFIKLAELDKRVVELESEE